MKKEKKQGKLKKKIQELKKTTRGKAILKLIYWSIFFVVLIVFCVISSFISKDAAVNKPQNKPKPIEPAKTDLEKLEEYEQDLLTSSFDYHYEITFEEEKIIFDGTKEKQQDTGYKETSSGIIKYVINETGVYQETTTEHIAIDNLYEGLNENYLKIENLMGILKELDFSRDDNCVEPCGYIATKDQVTYNIMLEKETIKNIFIKEDNHIYSFTFSNIEANS